MNIEKCWHKTFWNSAERHGTPPSPPPPPSMAGPLLRKKLVYFLFEKYLIIAQVSLCLSFKIQHQIWPWLPEQSSQSLTNINLLCFNFYHNYKLPKLNTIEPPNVTIPWKRPPPTATANPKHQTFPSQSLTVGTSSNRPPPVSDRDYFLGLMVNDFPLSILL